MKPTYKTTEADSELYSYWDTTTLMYSTVKDQKEKHHIIQIITFIVQLPFSFMLQR